MRKVTVKPLERKRWHNKKSEEFTSKPIIIRALLNPNTGKYMTGLTEEEKKEYSKKLGFSLDDNFIPGQPNPTWDERIKIKLYNHSFFLNLDNPLDYIKYKILKNSKFVANSMKEYNEGLYPEATHVIIEDDEEVKLKADIVSKKMTAYSKANKLSKEQKIAIIAILKNKNANEYSNEKIDVEIADIIENNIDEFLEYINLPKEQLKVEGWIALLIAYNVIHKKNGFYFLEGENLGMSISEVAKKALNSKDNSLLLFLRKKVEELK